MKRPLKSALALTAICGLASQLAAQEALVSASSDGQMQFVSNGDAKVGIWIPPDWKVHVWNLGLGEGSMSHVMDIESGRQVVVHMRECSAKRQSRWISGAEAERELGYRTDQMVEADPQTASPFPEAASFVTVAKRDSISYKSRAYFLSENDRCYLVEFVSVVEDFEASQSEFEKVRVRFVE